MRGVSLRMRFILDVVRVGLVATAPWQNLSHVRPEDQRPFSPIDQSSPETAKPVYTTIDRTHWQAGNCARSGARRFACAWLKQVAFTSPC